MKILTIGILKDALSDALIYDFCNLYRGIIRLFH